MLLCRTRLICSDQSVFYVSKINLQFSIINHNRDNIIKCIHMGIIFSFEEIAQYSLTFRIYDPVFPDTGALIFRNFFYVIVAAAGRTLHVPLLLCIYSLSSKSSSLISSWCTERGTSRKNRCPSMSSARTSFSAFRVAK